MINIQPYQDPQYFVILLIALLPLAIGLWHGHRFKHYEVLVSAGFITLMFTGEKWTQGVALLGYLAWQVLVIFTYAHYRQTHDQTFWFVVAVVASTLPLVIVKLTPVFAPTPSLLGFLGISYLTFKAVQIVMARSKP